MSYRLSYRRNVPHQIAAAERMSALHILLANEVTELGADLKKARHEIRTLKRDAIQAQRKPNQTN